MVEKLYDFKPDERMDINVLIKSADVRVAKNGNPYLALVLTDTSGEMPGMLWEANPNQVKLFVAGTIVHMQAVRQIYQNKPQLKIINLALVDAKLNLTPNDFVQNAPMQKQAMVEEVSQLLFQITNPTWARIVRYLLQKHEATFYEFPAAKTNHHAFNGGLAFHTLSIVHLAQSVSKQYTQVNESLLIAGALLHDLGKTIELSGAMATTYTTAGNLIGHITLVDEEIVLAAQALKLDIYSEDLLVLRHVVLAHHGLLEYGSPVRPAILEGQILHQLDELDASIQMFDNALAHTEPGKFSERIYGLSGRMVYRPTEDE